LSALKFVPKFSYSPSVKQTRSVMSAPFFKRIQNWLERIAFMGELALSSKKTHPCNEPKKLHYSHATYKPQPCPSAPSRNGKNVLDGP
jgi:hypothetical protein